MSRRPRIRSALAIAAALCVAHPSAQSPITAIVGGTLIDGNGGAPRGRRRRRRRGRPHPRPPARRPRSPVPAGATVIDAAGKFVVPGFIDTNVHLSLYGGVNDRYETLVRYHARQADIVLEAAQMQLAHGVTTVRDSYGVLPPLVEVRERIRARPGHRRAHPGRRQHRRLGRTRTRCRFSLIPERGLTLFQEQMNDQLAQGAGEDLIDMTPDELRVAINAYLDKGPDFIKFGGTATSPARRSSASRRKRRGCSSRRRTSAARRPRPTRPRPTACGCRSTAGIDLIQHPEVLGPRELPDALVKTIVERRMVGSMLVNTITGEAWAEAPEGPRGGGEEARRGGGQGTAPGPGPSAERRKDAADAGDELEMRRAERAEADRRRRRRHRRHRQLLGLGAGVRAHAEGRDPGPRHRHHPGHRGAGRAGHDADAGARRRRRSNGAVRRRPQPTSARSRPARSPTCSCSTPTRSPTSRTSAPSAC